MSYLLPLALLGVVLVLLLVIPWRHSDPNHVFMLEQWKRLAEDAPAEEINFQERPRSDSLAYPMGVGHRHGASSPLL